MLKRLISLTFLIGIASPLNASAGGLFMAGHGVRGMARGGAFTAGGDDPGGIWYNPANLGGLGGLQLLADSSLIFYRIDYQRIDSGGNSLDTVSNETNLLPIPTLALSAELWQDRLVAGVSLSAPYTPYPLAFPRPNYGPCDDPQAPTGCLSTVAQDSPQRYSLISMAGTFLMQLDLALAYRVLPQLTIGVSLQNMFVRFVSLNAISSNDGVISGAPEDPAYDSLARVTMNDMVNLSAKLGAIARLHRRIRLGASLQLPFTIGGDATLDVRLPVSPLYKDSRVEGDRANVSLSLPLGLRLGLEVQPTDQLRLELGFDWERWSSLDAIRVRPENVVIYNIPSIDRYRVGEQQILLRFNDSFAGRLGLEYDFRQVPLTLRAGYIFEKGAVSNAYASVLAVDGDKHLLTMGIGTSLSGYRLDAVFAHSFTRQREVSYDDSRSPQLNPINPAIAANVGGGSYRSTADIIGIGVRKAF